MNSGKPFSPMAKFLIRLTGAIVLTLLATATGFLTFLLHEKTDTYTEQMVIIAEPAATTTTPFPVGIDPKSQTITEQTDVAAYLEKYFAADFERTNKVTWFDRLYERVAYLPWYQSLASPNSRILVIFAGQRKEEVATNFGKILGWDKAEREEFIELVTTRPITSPDGTFFPGKYVTTPDAAPEAVAAQLQTAFTKNVLERYPAGLEETLPLEETLIIASMIEREARSFSDMQAVSGVIWNRLFVDMKLQLDATLQYARGSRPSEPWWPVPVPKDKYINSPFNTYRHKGLPPSPIANPSAAAILAALNPKKSDCLYYFHDLDGQMYCSVTYEEHKAKLRTAF